MSYNRSPHGGVGDDDEELKVEFARFRGDLRQILSEYGVYSNPGWTEEDIVNAFRILLLRAKW